VSYQLSCAGTVAPPATSLPLIDRALTEDGHVLVNARLVAVPSGGAAASWRTVVPAGRVLASFGRRP